MKRWRGGLTRLAQFGVTVALLAWIFHDPKMRADMAAALRQADPGWIGLGLLVAVIGDISNVVRWGVFLRVLGIQTSWPKIIWLFLTGLFFNLFLVGATGGDLVRIFYLVREEKTRRAEVVLSVVADRLIGLVVLIPLAVGVVVWRYQWLSQTPLATGLLWFLIIFLAVSTIVLVAASLTAGSGILEKLPAHFPGRQRLIKLGVLYHLFARRWRATLFAIVLSVPILLTFFGTFYCAARAFHAQVSLVDLFSIMPVVTVISSFPISISGLGVREKLFEDLLRDLTGTPGEMGVLISLLGFVLYLVWSLVGAVAYACFNPYTRVPLKEMRQTTAES